MSTAAASKKYEPTRAQSLAIAHSGSDLLISAGAGSGKTATLTDRIVKRICDKDNKGDISRMLVVTYTNDAASELKTRIAKKLSERLKDDPKNSHLCSQIVKVTSADISTIHSFCYKALRPHFDKIGLDSDFRIGEKNELEIIKLEAIGQVIDEFYEADVLDPDFLLVSDCYSDYTDDSTLGTSLLDLHTKLCSTKDGLEMLLKPMDSAEEFLATKYGLVLTEKLRSLTEHFLPLVSSLYSEICGDESNKKYFNTFEELFDILTRLDNALNNPRYEVIKEILNSYASKPFTPGKRNALPTVDVLLVSHVRDTLSAELKGIRDGYFYADRGIIESTFMQNEKICKAIYNVLKAYEKAYKEKKRKYSLCDFNDLERFTCELFYNSDGSISDIAKEISRKYDDLYIDEYQDVNSVQDKIFKAITRNNRFMVGDIKQSVYSFRSAEPELFSEYRDSFIPYDEKSKSLPCGKTIFMSENFRCDPSVIDLTNHISDYMFSKSRGFKYVAGDRLKRAKDLSGTFKPQNAELCLIDTGLAEGEEKPMLDPQAEFVAKEIKSLIDSGHLPNGRKIEPGDIAILLRKRKGSIEKYIAALTYYGIKHEYIQEVSFYEKPHILLLLCILNSVDNPSRDIYLAGALRSGILGFSLEELVKIKKESPREYSLYSALLNYGKDEKIREKIDKLLKSLSRYRAAIRNMSAHESIAYIMNETGFLSACNGEERQDAIKLYNIARGYEQGSYKGLYSFLRYVDDVASKKDIAETVASDPNNSVRIVTMHKSKGLEYEVCFLCDTEKPFSKKSYTAPILYSKRLGICGYVSRNGGIIKYDNLIRKCVSLAIKNAETEEALRILYVALTRARSKLYITAALNSPKDRLSKEMALSSVGDEYSVYSASSHLDIILGACSKPLDFLDIRVIDPATLHENDSKEGGKTENSLDYDKVEELEGTLRSRFDFEYGYSHLEKIPSKLSISTLYPKILDSEENEEYEIDYSINSVPSFVNDKKSFVKGSDRGTATHVFMQFCDFENLYKNGVDSELERLISKSFISPSVGTLIEKAHLEKFISSEMMQELLCAKEIIREFRFNVMLEAKEFSDDERLKKEKVLVQGVTDCIYENEQGELILVDYKTDRVTEENYESELRRKHTTQLTYYKKACEMMFERKIAKVLIYSVPLAKTVVIE